MSKGMIKMEFEAPNIDGIGQEAIDLLRPKAVDAIKDITKRMVTAFKKEVGRMGRGRDIASAPGEPPMTETKAYWRGFSRRVVNKKSKPYVEGQLGNRLWQPLGRFLNYGTKNRAPRPHIEPVLERNKSEIERRMGEL